MGNDGGLPWKEAFRESPQLSVRVRQSLLLTSAVSSAVAGLLIACPTANAINFTLNYDAAKTQAPTFDPTGSQLSAIFDYAATVYQDIFEDSHSLTITSGTRTSPAERSLRPSSRDRPPAEPPRRTFAWTPSSAPAVPNGSSFSIRRLRAIPNSTCSRCCWRDLSASEQAARFNAGAGIPATFEAGYVGLAKATAPADAQNGYDMLTSVIHEMATHWAWICCSPRPSPKPPTAITTTTPSTWTARRSQP